MAVKGRPKSEQKKQQICSAAGQLFTNQGFDGTSMDRVAELAGVSKQTVYSHFRNKDELFAATIAEKCVSYELSAEFLDDAKPCAEMLLEVGQRFIGLLMSKEAVCVYRLTVGGAEQHPTVARLFFQAGPDNMIGLLADYLARQHRKGRLNVLEPRTAACQFLFMVRGEAHMRATLNVEPNQTEEEIGDYVRSCVGVFMRAYGV